MNSKLLGRKIEKHKIQVLSCNEGLKAAEESAPFMSYLCTCKNENCNVPQNVFGIKFSMCLNFISSVCAETDEVI